MPVAPVAHRVEPLGPLEPALGTQLRHALKNNLTSHRCSAFLCLNGKCVIGVGWGRGEEEEEAIGKKKRNPKKF